MNDFKEYKAAFLEQNDLKHFGILGMRWGVRRYQNPDGSLTPAGVKRYNKDPKFWNKMNKDPKFRDHLERQHKKEEEKTKREIEEDELVKEMSKEGFDRDDGSYDDSFIKKNKDGSQYVILNNEFVNDSKESYNKFKQNKTEHLNNIKKEFKRYFIDEDLDIDKFDDNNFSITFLDLDSLQANYYDSFWGLMSLEYDLKKKKMMSGGVSWDD